jgi:Pvc16 N-terminal domain
MAGFRAIAATSKSLEQILNAAFAADEPVENKMTKAALVQSDDFDTTNGTTITTPGLSVFLYRIEVDKTMRAPWSAVGHLDGTAHLPIDLHYLLTAWADNAEHEHQIIGRAMQCLEALPILGGPLLHATGEWAANEIVQVSAEDLGVDAVTRTFDALEAEFRLSIGYVARVVRIDGAAPHDPTVTSVIVGKTPSAVP